MKSIVHKVCQWVSVLLVGLVALGAASRLSAQEIKPGDKVTVIKWDAEFKSGIQVIGKSELGKNYSVDKVNGNWLWIANHHGYLNRADVVPYDRAINHFTSEIHRNPQSTRAYHNRGCAWQERGELDIAIGDYNEAIRLNPESTAAYNSRGLAWRSKKDLDRAIADYNEVVRLDPMEARVFTNRGNVWDDKGELDRAIADHSEAIGLDPEYADAYYNRGIVWNKKQEYGRAIADYNEAIRLNSQFAWALENTAWLRASCPDDQFRNGAEAVRCARKACELTNWTDCECIGALAAGYAEGGDFAKAMEWQKRSLELVAKEDKKGFEERLALYKSGKPYREPLKVQEQTVSK